MTTIPNLKIIEEEITQAFVLGFNSEQMHFPITTLEALQSQTYPQVLQESVVNHAAKAGIIVPNPTWDLSYLFDLGSGSWLADQDKDGLADSLYLQIDASTIQTSHQLTAANNLACRMGMEVTSFQGEVIYRGQAEITPIRFRGDLATGIYLRDDALEIGGQGEALVQFISAFCNEFPQINRTKALSDLQAYLQEMGAMANRDGQLTYLNAYKDTLNGPLTLYMSPDAEHDLPEIPGVATHSIREAELVWEKDYHFDWEVADFKALINEQVYPQLEEGDSVRIEARLSDPAGVRKALEQELSQKLQAKGAQAEVHVWNAYKQGLSWLEEYIMPQLKESAVDAIEIAFRPFLKPEETEWKDEDGTVPTYGNEGQGDAEGWYDQPIRFLQELYPVDDLLAEGLSLDRPQICFVLLEDEGDATYRIKAFQADKVILEDSFSVSYSERPFMSTYPEMGLVHPNTGEVKVWVNGELLLAERIATDVERLWDAYQEDVLPKVGAYIHDKLPFDVDDQPLFAQLRMDIYLSEPNRHLPSREDMVSSLNALHQDLYFVGLDYFNNLGIDLLGQGLDAPGLILPVIHQAEGPGRMEVSLLREPVSQPQLVSPERIITGPALDIVKCHLTAIYQDTDGLVLKWKTNIASELLASFVELFNTQQLTLSRWELPVDRLVFTNGQATYTIQMPVYNNEPIKFLDIDTIDIPQTEVIGYRMYMDLIEQFSRVLELRVRHVGISYQGRYIYAIEFDHGFEGYVSRTKRLSRYPSEIINNRHHANEVSATNAAFQLVQDLVSNPERFKELQRLNLVIMPLENVDGAAIHYQLQQDNPTWKLHVARFNSVGKEFYYDYFKKDTIHTEALAFTKLYEEYLPDVVVDNHGVPSHEWEQPFSGYTSPAYRGFWLPRSLMYGYFWYIQSEPFQVNQVANKYLEDVIADAMAKDPEITAWNIEWRNRFEKYAHSWMPQLFPANYYKNMIHYWLGYDYDAHHRYPSIKYPWITSVAYTSEVSDETAQGDYLALCARTHVKHCHAVIAALLDANSYIERRQDISGTELDLAYIRQRPIHWL